MKHMQMKLKLDSVHRDSAPKGLVITKTETELTLPLCYQMYKHHEEEEMTEEKHIQTSRSAGCIFMTRTNC